jgi:hypothetical protein
MRHVAFAILLLGLVAGVAYSAAPTDLTGALPNHAAIATPMVANFAELTGTWTCPEGSSLCTEDSLSGAAKTELSDGDVVLLSDGTTYWSFTVSDTDASTSSEDHFRRARVVTGTLGSVPVLPDIDSSAMYLWAGPTASTLDEVWSADGTVWPIEVAQDELKIPSGVTLTIDAGATMSCPACNDFGDPATVTATGTDTATFIGADAAGAANTEFTTTGAGTVALGGASVTSIAITTDGTGDAEVALPENSIGADELTAFTDTVIFCGQADESGTIFIGPALPPFLGDGSASYAIGAVACDALDNATEATVDEPLTNVGAFKITGMRCVTDGTLGAAETLTFALRTAEGATVPSVTCALAVGETYCSTVVGTTTDIAAGATVAVSVIEASDNADDNVWCEVGIAYK